MAESYKVVLHSRGLTAEKTEYAAGECVTVWNLFNGSDMCYSFYVNASDQKQIWKDGKTGVQFTMPAHDVEVSLGTESCMMAPKPVQSPFGFGMMAAALFWKCANCGETGNQGKFCTNCGARQPE